MSKREFLEFLIQAAKLSRLDFPFPHRAEPRYVWGDVPLLAVLLTLKNDSYFTHYTAMRMHGLSEHVPNVIYINHEQARHPKKHELDQDRIDAAFRNAPRVSRNFIDFENARIYLINGMHTGQLGVTEQEVNWDSKKPIRVRLTDIERTLIDIAVRPIYSGGVFEVLNAFRLAKERASADRLAATLRKLDYTYPFHQAIGFYAERAGYGSEFLDLLHRFPIDFDFYLSHNMGQYDYVKHWWLYVPKGF